MSGPVNFVSPSARLGRNVKVWHFACVGDGAVLGDDVMIASLVHIDAGASIGDRTRVQPLTIVSRGSSVGRDVTIGPGVTFTNHPYPPGRRLSGVRVGDGAVINAGCTIGPGVAIGRGSVVGMGAVVTRDVPDGAVVMGVPARRAGDRPAYEAKRAAWEAGG